MAISQTLLIFFLFFVLLGREGEVAWAEKTKGQAKEQARDPAKEQATEKDFSLPEIPRVAPSLGAAKVTPNPSVAEVQRELERVVQIHQSLQSDHLKQVREIQRITEQARAHQQLLKDLEKIPRVPPTRPGTDVEGLIRLEKIRLIQEQTRQNRAALEEFQKKATQTAQKEKGKVRETKPSRQKQDSPRPKRPAPPPEKKVE